MELIWEDSIVCMEGSFRIGELGAPGWEELSAEQSH